MRTHPRLIAARALGVPLGASLVLGLVAALLVPPVAQAQPENLIPPSRLVPLPAEIVQQLAAPPPITLAHPPALDWREAGIITTPKHQLHCGGCWAFAAIACLEAMAIRAGAPPTLDLSEQYLLSCDTFTHSYGGFSASNDGCCGGTFLVFDFLRDWPAIDEAFYAYGDGDFDGDGPRDCDSDPEWNTIPCPSHLPPHAGWRVVGWHPLPADLAGVVSRDVLKDAIQQSPVWLGYKVYDDFITYWLSGSSETPYRHTTGAWQGWHAVLLIGYDDDRNAWIVKNSWGATGGPFDDGTFMIDYDEHDCGFGTNATVITAVTGGAAELHACCVGETCQVVSGAECIALGGDWLESLDSCEPSPCPTPAAPTSVGRLKSLFR